MQRILPPAIVILVLVAGVHLLGTGPTIHASPSLFYGRCAGCHADDSATCVGCHFHRGALSAGTDQDSYLPGETVTVTLDGGGYGGWIRALLYDGNDVEVDRVAGPTGTGDDGLGDPVEFPVVLQAPAPMEEGEYTWEAGWYGANNLGTDHLEATTPVTIQVAIDTGVEDGDVPRLSGAELRLSGFPSPQQAHGVVCMALGPDVRAAALRVLDSSGRSVRTLATGLRGPQRRELAWDGCDDQNRRVPAGTYFAFLTEGDRVAAHPIVVLR
ncbi:MAG: hypothetical protein GF330_14110 [Candidatus Eisenbacteria bacterium]|nr:hypothetical protein [Candidatus Eisenbacteria bacterium]